MNDLKRLRELLGINPQAELLRSLKESQKDVNENFDRVISQVTQNVPVMNEGLFSSLMTAFKTATNMGSSGVSAIKKKARDIGAAAQEFYKSARAKAELDLMYKGFLKTVQDIEKIWEQTKTLQSKDPTIKDVYQILFDLFKKTEAELKARMVVAEGIVNDPKAIDKMLAEMDMISEGLKDVVKKGNVIIQDGEFKGNKGTVVFSKSISGKDLRYYVIELNVPVKGVEVVVVYNGEFDWE